jgi:hypothetical protein
MRIFVPVVELVIEFLLLVRMLTAERLKRIKSFALIQT